MSINNSGSVSDAFARLHVSEPNHNLNARSTTITSNDNNSFKDVTEIFRQASQALQIGQLVKVKDFTLFEAVGALEIMDVKMDSGLMKPGEEETVFDVLQVRSAEEIIGIMDQLLSSEMSWHNGSALSQTIFTCLYVDRLLSTFPMTLDRAQLYSADQISALQDSPEYLLLHLVLRAYILGLIKCCDIVNRQIIVEHIYEEEDFVTQTYNVPLLELVNPLDIINLLNSAMEYVESSGPDWSADVRMALKARLAFRCQFLSELARDMEELIAGASNWDACISLLSTIGVTRNAGKPVPQCFSTSVQRKLASTVPPRPLVITPFEEAFTVISRLCKDAKEILKILDYKGATNLMTFFVHFMARKPQPCPYIRACLQTLLSKNDVILGSKSLKQVIYDDLKELVLPADDLLDPVNESSEAPHDARFKIAKRMSWFVEKAGMSYIALYRMICQNRSRLRRNLCHSIVDWDALQIECEEVDQELKDLIHEEPQTLNGSLNNAFSLSSWVYHYKLKQMEWIVFLGFELEVYLPYEFAGMFWYLRYFLRTRLQHLERIRHFVHPSVSANSALARTRTASIVNQNQAAFPYTMATVNFTLLEAAGLQELSSAMIYLYVSLARLDLVKPPPQPYSNDSLRYDLRMKPFLTIGCPEVLPYDDFMAMVDTPEIEIADLLEMASDATKEARKHFEVLSKMDATTSHALLCEEGYRLNLRECLKSCIGTGVAIAMIAKAIQNNSVADVEVEVNHGLYHPWFPVPRIASKKKPPAPGKMR